MPEDSVTHTPEIQPQNPHREAFARLDERKTGTQKILQQVADQTLPVDQALKQITKLYSTDPMTGLREKTSMMERLQLLMDYCKEHNLPLTIMLLDGDKFKKFNDMYGHEVGDDVIRVIGKSIQEGTRGGDVQARLGEKSENEKVTLEDGEEEHARLGGDEFCVVLPGATPEHTALVIERIKQAVAKNSLTANIPEPIFLSGGVASYDPSRHTDPAQLMKEADAAMYHAKQSGGNQLAVATYNPETREHTFPPLKPALSL